MTRVDDNKIAVESIIKKTADNGIFEKMICWQLAAMNSLLIDISKSLAIMADKGEPE